MADFPLIFQADVLLELPRAQAADSLASPLPLGECHGEIARAAAGAASGSLATGRCDKGSGRKRPEKAQSSQKTSRLVV